MIRLIAFLILSTKLAVSQDENTKINVNCRERQRLVTTEKGDLYTITDVTKRQKLILQCHYCKENDDGRAKNWYKIEKLGISKARNVKLSMDNENERNRLHVNVEHSLIIHNFSKTDCGLYYCVSFEEENKQDKFNYLVDLVFHDNTTDFESGNITAWSKYHDDYLAPVNKLFLESDGEEFAYIREKLLLNMELITQWDSWGICEVCGRPKGESIKKKAGFCRIKITPKNPNITLIDEDEIYLLNANALSCKSERLGDIFEGISNLTRVIPDFVLFESCEGACNPDEEGVNKGWKVGKSKGYKYRKTFVLAQDAHLTLVCPEATLDNIVIWRRNSKTLKAGESVQPKNPDEDPRIIVDTFNTLYLLNVQSSEEGNYSCQVDDIKMQVVIIFVVSKSKLLTQVFVRHLMYLGFVLSLTLSCYCAGLIVTFNRRHTFRSYEELREEERKKMKKEGLVELEALL